MSWWGLCVLATERRRPSARRPNPAATSSAAAATLTVSAVSVARPGFAVAKARPHAAGEYGDINRASVRERAGHGPGHERRLIEAMPELPEVETIRRQLAPHLEGRRIVDVQILDPRWTRPEPPEVVEQALRGRRVREVGRQGKYLVWGLSGDLYLLIHLRMTGALRFDPDNEPAHTRVRFRLDAGHRLAYVDPRRFGTGH